MKKTYYTLSGTRFGKPTCFAIVADLHGREPSAVIEALREEKPDYILMPGDIFEVLDGVEDALHENALRLLSAAASIAPTFYSAGNHEDGGIRSWSSRWKRMEKPRAYAPKDLARIEQTGAVFLQDSFVLKNGIAFGGLASGLICKDRKPSLDWLGELCRVDAPRVLLCHHPEYYEPYLRVLPIDLIVSGHAHGGQWRFFGRGVFSPGQGLFPKYTSGVHDDRFVISTGLKPSGKIPRIFNAPEVVFLKA